ncbi:tetratricopeptide repeat protein [Sphingobacteriales bacterium UPWRP_1]|nr:hypothetical protein BVG80_09400 [Sphingobacteriales bacterium TSM_CSM]PSJ78567.1 tetratricopeptide repeat protein [Sphingobacteriales bacterium UPWRP_1]
MLKTIVKHLLFCCLFILLCQPALPGNPAADLVKQGNDAYAGADYAKAAQLYEQALAQGVESAALYYNLGNAYYRQQKTAFSILNYERALKLQPHNKAAQNNLQLAKERIANPIDELPEVFYRRWWAAVLGILPSGIWAGGAVLFLWLSAGLGILFFLSATAKQKKYSFAGAVSCLVLAVLLHVFAYNRHQNETAKNYAVIMQPAANLKKGPSDSSESTAELPEGAKVRTNERVNGWVRITLTDNREGWVNEQNLTTI